MKEISGGYNSLNFGLRIDGRLIAMSVGMIRHWWEGTNYNIEELCVLPEYQGQGVGSGFLKRIEEEIQIRGLAGIFLQTDSDKPSYGFYHKLGFSDLGAHVSLYKSLPARISPAGEGDKEEILALYRMQIGQPFCPWDDEYPSSETIDDDLSRDALFVMKENHRIIAAISIDEEEEIEKLTCWNRELAPAGELSRLAVLPEKQGRGIARQMLKYGMRVLRERGCKSIHFLVNRYNQKAIRSYAPLGFQTVGQCHMFDQDFYCYEKEL